jgi:hypothetical protein
MQSDGTTSLFNKVILANSIHDCFALAVTLDLDLSVEFFNILPPVKFI